MMEAFYTESRLSANVERDLAKLSKRLVNVL
ncbi:hypothetical protein FGSG_13578 [Fusarium graminearum PH-1]|nr:hypothetical protein FGSG_13578 [Fusarium graminearum PH-1]ESU16004.1 hypothetical protein FGSG_13578 [Fusarium graminearum PH-1]|eukprot:XP_011328312.1 hypothetical protein FGSG_13578 [Fusarium graminearum PH-1]